MLVRYDLCERAARRMWIELLKMNGCGSWRGLAEKILQDHPQLDRQRLEDMAWMIRIADD